MYIPNNWKKMYDGSYAVDGSVAITKDYISDGRLRVRFHKVTGDFDCKYLNLHTLEGCHKKSVEILTAKAMYYIVYMVHQNL